MVGPPADPNFDPFRNLRGYEHYAASFVDANSDVDVARIKERIDTEHRRAELMESAGAYGMLGELLAQVADPINLVPVAGLAAVTGRAGYRAGVSALRFGATTAASTATQEAILHSTQYTRTAKESGVNVAASALLGSVLGGAVGAFAGRDLTALAKGALDESDVLARATDRGSVGAAATRNTTMAQETLSGALGTEKALAFMAPTTRAAVSDSIETRRVMQDLAELPLRLEKNSEGIATPVAVESNIRQWKYPLANTLTFADDQFVQYRLGRARRVGDVAALGVRDAFGPPDGALSRPQFLEEVGRSMRRGDQHEIPEVAATAQRMRRDLFDPLKDAAIEAGLLPKDVDPKTATSYLMRLYDHDKLAARPNEFVSKVSQWYLDEQAKKRAIQEAIVPLTAQRDAAAARITDLEAKITAAQERGNNAPRLTAQLAKASDEMATVRQAMAGHIARWEGNTAKAGDTDAIADRIAKANLRLDKIDMDSLAYQTLDRIKSTPDGRLPYDMQTPEPAHARNTDERRGPLASRVFMIPDHLIEDFLVSDVGQVARAYERTMAPDVELARRFGRVDMQDQIEAIRNSYAALRTAATTEKEAKRLDARMDADIRDVAAVRDRLRGVYALPADPDGLAVRAAKVVKDLNYVRLLGGMTLSAIPDVGRVVMQHGLMRLLDDGITPMLRNWQTFKLAARETKLAGTALDMVLDSRTMAIADIVADYGRGTALERGVHATANKFGVVSLMAPWNAALKQLVGVMSQTRSLEAIEALAAGTIKPAERTRLAQFGIDEAMAARIGAEFKTHGQVNGGVRWANTGDWTDIGAARAYRAALAKEVDAVIVTPGQEKPLWMSTQLGGVLGQFKSFSMVSTQRVLMAGLQQRDAAAFNGAALMVGLGMLSHYLKADEKRLAEATPATLLKEGIDRSGVTGIFFDVNNIVEKATRGAIGVSRLTGTPMMSRYASRNVVDALLGPTVGAAADAATVTGAAASSVLGDAEWKPADTHALRRMVPFQNLIGWRALFDRAEEGINRMLGGEQR